MVDDDGVIDADTWLCDVLPARISRKLERDFTLFHVGHLLCMKAGWLERFEGYGPKTIATISHLLESNGLGWDDKERAKQFLSQWKDSYPFRGFLECQREQDREAMLDKLFSKDAFSGEAEIYFSLTKPLPYGEVGCLYYGMGQDGDYQAVYAEDSVVREIHSTSTLDEIVDWVDLKTSEKLEGGHVFGGIYKRHVEDIVRNGFKGFQAISDHAALFTDDPELIVWLLTKGYGEKLS